MWLRAFALQVLTDLNIGGVTMVGMINYAKHFKDWRSNGLKHLSLNKGVLAEPSIVSRS